MQALHLVYRYRVLMGKCASGAGLTFDEIAQLTELEAAFAAGPDDLRAAEGRRHRRERVHLPAVLRGGDLHDAVTVAELSPGGLVCRGAPYAEAGTIVDLVIDDHAARRSYRFKGQVQWVGDDADDDFRLGIELTGTPVMIRYLDQAATEPLAARIAA